MQELYERSCGLKISCNANHYTFSTIFSFANYKFSGISLKLEFPYINRTVDEGTIIQWHKQPGEWVQYGDLLCDIQVTKVKNILRMREKDVKALVYLGLPEMGPSDDNHKQQEDSTNKFIFD